MIITLTLMVMALILSAWMQRKSSKRITSVEEAVEAVAEQVSEQGDSLQELQKSVDSTVESISRLERAKAATKSLAELNPHVFGKSEQPT